jgi:hypothetical protein
MRSMLIDPFHDLVSLVVRLAGIFHGPQHLPSFVSPLEYGTDPLSG